MLYYDRIDFTKITKTEAINVMQNVDMIEESGTL